MLLLELLLLALLVSAGSCGLNPLAFAKRFRISVKLTTPESRPDMLAPGMADADMAGAEVAGVYGGDGDVTARPAVPVEGRGVIGEGGTRTAGVMAGVGGPDEEGEGLSTIHMRCDLVATSFATVCASVEKGFTWKTGKGSLPSFMPRSDRMTEMKWMQEEWRRGRDVDLVRSLTST